MAKRDTLAQLILRDRKPELCSAGILANVSLHYQVVAARPVLIESRGGSIGRGAMAPLYPNADIDKLLPKYCFHALDSPDWIAVPSRTSSKKGVLLRSTAAAA